MEVTIDITSGLIPVPVAGWFSCPVALICCPWEPLGGLRQFRLKCPIFPQLKQALEASISMALGSLAGWCGGA